MKQHSFVAAILITAAIVLAIAIGSAVLSYWPLDEVREILDALAPDGVADDFPITRIAGIRWKLRIFSLTAAILSVLFFLARRRLSIQLRELLNMALSFIHHLRRVAHNWWINENRFYVIALLVLTLIGVFIRAVFLSQPMRVDEATSFIEFVSRPLAVGVSYYPAPNNHLFHTILEHASFFIFGEHEWALRLPAFLAGVLLIPAAYVIASIHYGRNAAILAATLITVSSPLILYSTNARGYTLLCLFFLLLLIVAGSLAKENLPGGWIFLVIISALGLFTIPIMAYAIGVTVLWIVLERRAGGSPKLLDGIPPSVLATGLITLILYSPALVVTGPTVLSDNALSSSVWFFNPPLIFHFIQRIWMNWNSDLPIAAVILITGAVIIQLAFRNHLGRYKVSIGCVTLLSFIPILLITPSTPYTRIFLFLLPVYLVFSAAGISALISRLFRKFPAAGNSTVVALCMLFAVYQAFWIHHTQAIYWNNETGTFRDAPDIADYLKGRLSSGDYVEHDPNVRSILAYYFRRQNLPMDHLYGVRKRNARTIYVVRKSEADQQKPAPAANTEDQPILMKEFRETLIYQKPGSRW